MSLHSTVAYLCVCPTIYKTRIGECYGQWFASVAGNACARYRSGGLGE